MPEYHFHQQVFFNGKCIWVSVYEIHLNISPTITFKKQRLSQTLPTPLVRDDARTFIMPLIV